MSQFQGRINLKNKDMNHFFQSNKAEKKKTNKFLITDAQECDPIRLETYVNTRPAGREKTAGSSSSYFPLILICCLRGVITDYTHLKVLEIETRMTISSLETSTFLSDLYTEQ